MTTAKRLLALLFLAGCATPELTVDEPTSRQFTIAHNALKYSDIEPARDIGRSELLPAVNRIVDRVRNASVQVCGALDMDPDRCLIVQKAGVTVYNDDRTVNAFADANNNVAITGGLVSRMGSDDEIAAVLAHEFSHVMYDHVGKTMINSLAGTVLGATAGILLAAAVNSTNPEPIINDMTSFGTEAGRTAYSPSMEIEADRTAVYILKRAGFDTKSMRHTIVRMSRLDSRRHGQSGSGKVGFLQTHPSDWPRVAHIVSSIEDAKSGIPLKRRSSESSFTKPKKLRVR